MRKVLFMSPVSYFKGGAETSLFDLLRNPLVEPVLAVPSEGPLSVEARKLGIAVEVVPFGAIEEIHRPVQMIVLLRAVNSWISAAYHLQKIAQKHGVKIIHTNGLKAHAVAILARAFGSPPVVTHFRDIAVQRREKLIWRAIRVLSNRMVIVSRPCWPVAGKLPSNVAIIHNGINIDALPAIAQIADDTITFGFCGRIHHFKGVDTLLLWLRAALNAGVNCRLIIRGEADLEDLAYEQFLLKKVQDLDLAEFVEFQGKKVGLISIYTGIDVVVVPSTTPDPLPRSVMEAMGMGLAVIGYPAGGIPYMIDDRVNGWLVSTPEQFCAVARIILDQPAIISSYGQLAKSKMKEKFTLTIMYSSINDLYESIDT